MRYQVQCSASTFRLTVAHCSGFDAAMRVEDTVSRETQWVSRSHFVAACELREGIWCSLFKTGEAAPENELDLVGRAVALFGDKDIGHVALFGGGVEIEEIAAIDEHDNVGVLFDRAGFVKIGQLGAALVAFGSTGELAEDQDGSLQFLGEAFEPARNAGDFFLAGIKPATSGDELEVVDDEEREALVALEAASFGTDFEDAGGTGVIHPQR